MPVDPVCGIEMDESLALVHEHEDKKYYFCCNGCRKIFMKKPKKYKNQNKRIIVLLRTFQRKFYNS